MITRMCCIKYFCWTSSFICNFLLLRLRVKWDYKKFIFHSLAVEIFIPYFPLAVYFIFSSFFPLPTSSSKKTEMRFVIENEIIYPHPHHTVFSFFFFFVLFICMIEKSFTICLNFLYKICFSLTFGSYHFTPALPNPSSCSFNTSSDICSHYVITYG